MRNLCDEWARAMVDDLNAEPPEWLPEGLTIRAAVTTDVIQRPTLMMQGTEEARSHPRLAVGSITLDLHWHRNDGTPVEAREILRRAAQEVDLRRDGVHIENAVMTWYMPAPEEEQQKEDGWVFRAIRDVRMRANTIGYELISDSSDSAESSF